MHVERKRIDVSRVDSKDMDNLMPRSPLELEDILDDLRDRVLAVEHQYATGQANITKSDGVGANTTWTCRDSR